MVYTYEYNYINYDPSMPMVKLKLGLKRDKPLLNLTALIDSGADATIVPAHYLHQIGAMPSITKWMRGIAGGGYEVSQYTLFIQIGDIGRYISVVGDELYNEVIVGRDILNQLVVKLDGIAQVTEIET